MVQLQLNLRIKSRVYVSHRTVYEKAPFLARTGVRKNSIVASEYSPIKIDYFDYPKSYIENRKLWFRDMKIMSRRNGGDSVNNEYAGRVVNQNHHHSRAI